MDIEQLTVDPRVTIRRSGHPDQAGRGGPVASGLTLYFVCEAVGSVASFALWVVNGLWPRATVDRVVTWNLLLAGVECGDSADRGGTR